MTKKYGRYPQAMMADPLNNEKRGLSFRRKQREMSDIFCNFAKVI